MSQSQDDHRNAAHQSAVSDILSARRNALNALMKLSIATNVRWKEPFVNGNSTQFKRHPLREAHAYTLLYAHNVANKSYWPKEKSLFIDAVETPTGKPLKVSVPDQEEVEIESNQSQDEITLRVAMLEHTTEEKVTLEQLNYRWEKRQVRIHVLNDSPYYKNKEYTIQKDVLLPPHAVSLTFKQLDELAASLEFLAEPTNEIPTYGFREVEEHEE